MSKTHLLLVPFALASMGIKLTCTQPAPPTTTSFSPGAAINIQGCNYFATSDPEDGWWCPLFEGTSLMVTCPASPVGGDHLVALYSAVNGGLTRDEALAATDEELCELVCSPYWPDPTPGNGADNDCQVQRPSCPECQPETQQVHVTCTGRWAAQDWMNFCQEDCPDGQFCMAQFMPAQ